MADAAEPNPNAEEHAADTSKTGEDGANKDEGQKEGTTPEEVARVLKGTGIKLPEHAKAKDESAKKTEETSKDEKEVVVDTGKPAADIEENILEDTPAGGEPTEGIDLTDHSGKQFSLEVTDAEGNTYTVKAGDSLEEALKDFVPKSNGQILQILKDLSKLEDDKAVYEADQAKANEDAEKSERVQAIRTGWDEEIKQLQATKRLPATTKGEDNARVAEVYKFMAEENTKRIAAGRPTLNSFEDALDKLENIEGRQAKENADKEERDNARKNGSLVGGTSAPSISTAPVYRTGSARNANEAIRALGLLK